MHDHNKVNYNNDYTFSNTECNVHLLRDLQKVTENLGHSWSGEMNELLEHTNKERNVAMSNGEEGFESGKEQYFYETFDKLMLKGLEENKVEKDGRYYVSVNEAYAWPRASKRRPVSSKI